jgi:hypothetical protein
VVARKDWLLRFGSELIFTLCDIQNIEIVVINQGDPPPLGREEDLAQDAELRQLCERLIKSADTGVPQAVPGDRKLVPRREGLLLFSFRGEGVATGRRKTATAPGWETMPGAAAYFLNGSFAARGDIATAVGVEYEATGSNFGISPVPPPIVCPSCPRAEPSEASATVTVERQGLGLALDRLARHFAQHHFF